MKQELVEPFKTCMDVVSVCTMLGALVKLLPSIAALLTIVWTGIRIYETRTVQNFLKRKKDDDQK